MFELGSHVVCPGHGVGKILSIEDKEIGNDKKSFYQIKILTNGMTVMIPVDSKSGIRTLVNEGEVERVFGLLKNHDVKVDNSTWNRRYRDYMNKVKTGSLLEIADVLRSLFLLSDSKSLSFGERQMLEQCKGLLVKEIAISQGHEEKEIENQIKSCFIS